MFVCVHTCVCLFVLCVRGGGGGGSGGARCTGALEAVWLRM